MPVSASPVLQPEIHAPRPTDGFVDRFGGRYYRIANIDRMPVFFMNVVSSSDVWLFLASNGALSAGRANADHAIFPYQTVDRICDASAHTGGCTAVLCERDGETVLWEPLSAHGPRYLKVERHLYKSLEGDRVWLEEIHPALGLAFRCGWTATDEHGLVRLSEIENLGDSALTVRLIDGVRNLMVPGVSQRLQNEFSCLTDAYKTAEVVPGTSLAAFSLAAGIVDRAIPMESLLATTAWSEGWSEARITLAADACERFLADRPTGAPRARGTRACYALEGELTLRPGQIRRWRIALDTDRSQIDVSALADRLRDPVHIHAELDSCLASGSARLRALVASADGLQLGGDEIATAHHFANTLFNIMRGGVFACGHEVDTADFLDFARLRNRPAAARHAALLAALPPRLAHRDFTARLSAPGDADLERLAHEYLPLTFSRRHGDPSRPWNKFNIRVRDAAGNRVLNHEGNWRDIFQNWEALCVSFPSFCESIVAKFVNASTADGYNPYRITRAGIDWEIPEPHDPWASIGYWGDHQTIYLLKLLEWSARFHPGLADSWLRRPVFAYAAVPYRISNYAAIRANPRSTIAFDADAHRRIAERARDFGTDARLLAGPDGRVLHVNLSEKLLLLVLTRLTNLVPGGGIWMNTQRPEWNDANNALVGNGLSVVTLAYLRRFLARLRDRVLPALGAADVPVSSAVAALLREMTAVLDLHSPALSAPGGFDDQRRRAFVDAAGEAGSRYRDTVYRDGPGAPVPVSTETLSRLVLRALDYVDHSLRANRRPDGLWHAYNLLRFSENPPALSLGHLAPMLEGQVAVLSSGLLPPDEVVALLRSLRHSPLYRADQHSYLLYPDKQLPPFLLRNNVPAAAVEGNELLSRLARAGDRRLVARDAAGGYRFHPDLVNADALGERLDALARDPDWTRLVENARAGVEQIYEDVFHHREFTGRSSSMFGYEGLGCIYWHMVAKLLLAVQENQHAAEAAGHPAAAALAEHYRDIRDGLGFRKSARVYGAFPTDPYSHTPGHAGAQQPGMTGQVKEELLTRLGETGVRHLDGRIRFLPGTVSPGEFTRAPATFTCLDSSDRTVSIELPAGAFAFTLCGVPVVYRDAADTAIHVVSADGATRAIPGTDLPADVTRSLFDRDGSITRIEVLARRPAGG